MLVLWVILSVLALLVLVCVFWPLLLSGKRILVVTAILVLACATLLVYWRLGSLNVLEKAWELKADVPLVRAMIKRYVTKKNVITALQSNLKLHPKSAKGWYLLGHLYVGTGDYIHAVKDFRLAHYWDPSNRQDTLALVNALLFLHHGRLPLEGYQLLKDVLKQSPNNIFALNLLAVNAYERKHYLHAIHLWLKIAPQFPAGSKNEAALLDMISHAQKQLSLASTVS